MTNSPTPPAHKVLARSFRLYDGDTKLAPMCVLPVPPSVGDSQGDAISWLVDTTERLGIDLQVVTAKLFQQVTANPDTSESKLLKVWDSLGVTYTQIGVAFWRYEDDDECEGYEELPDRVFCAAKVATTNDSQEEHIAVLNQDADGIAEYNDLDITKVYEVDCGEV